MTIRTRFAPSPTGVLHVGGARTAVLNWLLARHYGGDFIVRIEDTDVERNVAGAEAAILDDLRWLGLDWDEGPDVGGAFAPYRQSERGDLYLERVQRLLAADRAYVCTCRPRGGDGSGGRCPCADRASASAIPAGAAVRLRTPDEGPIVVEDAIRGRVVFGAETVEDFVILRSNTRPTYNFAAAVDDHAMRITHVVRGADHLNNTPKQLLVYRALGAEPPAFAHIPLVLGPDRQKLSKRHGATSVAEYRQMGLLPEALLNYLSLLSWSSPSGEEMLPRERLVREISLDRLGASDAVFDREKLRWLSSRYLRELPAAELVRRITPVLRNSNVDVGEDRLGDLAEALRERISVLAEAPAEARAFTGPSTPEQRARRAEVLSDPAARQVLDAVAGRLADVEPWDAHAVDRAIRDAGAAAGARGRGLFHPVRVALTGEERGPELARVALVLGREATLKLLRPAGK